MKYLILLLVLVSGVVQAQDLPTEAKQVIFDEISSIVFFEDEGAVRAPTNVEDFEFTMTDEFTIRVQGKSYSDWDMKELSYDCSVELTTRGMIKSNKDINVTCSVENEEWPYWN